MVCCILALLLAGPLGVALAPPWARPGTSEDACCTPRYVFLRSAAVLIGVVLFSLLIAASLNFLDPPAFHHLCSWRAFR